MLSLPSSNLSHMDLTKQTTMSLSLICNFCNCLVTTLVLFSLVIDARRANLESFSDHGSSIFGSHVMPSDSGMSLWIDERQVKEYSGFPMKIQVIVNSVVLPYIIDPNFEKYLPVIPPQLSSVNFTWKAGDGPAFYYHFDQLISHDRKILDDPVISIESKGRVPRKPRVFILHLPCLGNASGLASFAFGLRILNDAGLPIAGTPLRLKLQKQCSYRAPDPECDMKCANGGWCNREKICECPNGYVGQYCHSALCYPVCMNGGNCIAPGQCSCPDGFQGPHCEGGICREKCLNGGKCVQKDTCLCRKGYFGLRCENSKCSHPCYNRGRCVGINRCRCRGSFTGSQCEIEPEAISDEDSRMARRRRRKKKKFV